MPDRAFLHDDDTFRVQWNAMNLDVASVGPFTDRLVITEISEGCPGSDDEVHTVVFDSSIDGNPTDFVEPAIAGGTAGPLMAPLVGPFPAAAYRLTVTLDEGGPNPVTTFNCVNIERRP
jgi:hypothetical protein